ncbi:hypothetical protein P7K49_029991 [Saguinus oedipus]|uniref:Uncharacterized protein n=1 Tax=Saguinus oedipus TaxID=9490 RepID=A0ABQ9U8S6_SAGOE|nr:hypothetical protein P7K49_029991 [Saguinus oedipus]
MAPEQMPGGPQRECGDGVQVPMCGCGSVAYRLGLSLRQGMGPPLVFPPTLTAEHSLVRAPGDKPAWPGGLGTKTQLCILPVASWEHSDPSFHPGCHPRARPASPVLIRSKQHFVPATELLKHPENIFLSEGRFTHKCLQSEADSVLHQLQSGASSPRPAVAQFSVAETR